MKLKFVITLDPYTKDLDSKDDWKKVAIEKYEGPASFS